MIDFKTPQKEDLPRLRSICESCGTMGCDCNPVNIYIWRNKYNIKICFYKGFLLKAYFSEDAPWGYCFPIGEGDISSALSEIFEDARQRGVAANLVMLTDAQKERLVEITGCDYSFKELYGDGDYIYRNYDLCALPGKKYHGKRGHISKFDRLYPHWHFEIMNENNMSDAEKVAVSWCEARNINPRDNDEFAAMSEVFENYRLLRMHGGVLYADSAPVAMTMGSLINRSTFDVIFEKALTDYEGSYAKINNEFAKTLVGFEFINREEDMGIDSLRKAKLSYHPVVVLKRFSGVKNA